MSTEETMLIKVSAAANNNKFYHVVLSENTVKTRWGRVGNDGQTSTLSGGRTTYDRIIREKMRKGYEKTEVVTDHNVSEVANQDKLAKVAKTVLTSSKGNPELDALIDRLVAVNQHEIIEASGGLIKVDKTSGRITTPLGLIRPTSIATARTKLAELDRLSPKDSHYLPVLEEYLRLVPQKVPARRGWHETFFNKDNTVLKQREFLDQLSDSLKWAEANEDATKAAAEEDGDLETKYEKLFKYKIDLVDARSDAFAAVVEKYQGSLNKNHPWHYLKVQRVFELQDDEGSKRFEEKASQIRNVQQLWHGSRSMNVLSILRKGLYCPPVSGSGIRVTGRMFSEGYNSIYFSNQSSKSMGYSYGYWSGARESNCFMFLADVALGSEFRPSGTVYDPRTMHKARTTVNKFGKPWNSVNVKPGVMGVRNHEALVWDTDQIRMKYLVEFGA